MYKRKKDQSPNSRLVCLIVAISSDWLEPEPTNISISLCLRTPYDLLLPLYAQLEILFQMG